MKTPSPVNNTEDGLLDCLIFVARHHGLPANKNSLTAGLPLREGKVSPELLERAASRAGLNLKISSQSFDLIDKLNFPAILFLKNEGACVLQSVTSQGDYVVHTPETADRVVNLSKDELSAQYCGIAALISPRLRFDNRTPTLRRVRGEHWFWSAMLRQLPAYKDSILGSLLINIFAIALPIFAMVTYDRVVPNNAVETLWALAVGDRKSVV